MEPIQARYIAVAIPFFDSNGLVHVGRRGFGDFIAGYEEPIKALYIAVDTHSFLSIQIVLYMQGAETLATLLLATWNPSRRASLLLALARIWVHVTTWLQ